MAALKDHRGVVNGVMLHWYWETTWRCWVVTAYDEDGDQIGESQTCANSRVLEWTKEQVAKDAKEVMS